jgi:hypothetical protein
MKSQGYQVAYDYPYSHATTLDELKKINSKCSAETVLCAGGVASWDSDKLLLVSCGNCKSVLTQTPRDEPVLNNGAYWYLTKNYSFGFSPSHYIYQFYVDGYDCDYFLDTNPKCSSNERLSWRLDGIYGGWRIGQITQLRYSDLFRKIIILS